MLLASCMRASSAGVLMERQAEGGGGGMGEGGAGVGDAVGEDELSSLLDTDLAGGNTGSLEGFGEKFVGILVFIPGVDARCRGGGQGGGGGIHAFPDTAFFEDGTDDEGVAFCG